jgi:NADH-quinone oxidoreductase subunit M
MFQRVMQGPLNNPANQRLTDLTPREIAVLVPLVIVMFVIGIYPNLFLNAFDQSVVAIQARVAAAAGTPPVAQVPTVRQLSVSLMPRTQRNLR